MAHKRGSDPRGSGLVDVHVPPERQALDELGRMLMQDVRDRAIVDWDLFLQGKMKGDRAPKIRKLLAKLGAEQLEVFERLMPAVVDSVLHHLCFALEQQDRKPDRAVAVAVQVGPNKVENLAGVSDGLAGELSGWVGKFSQQRHGTLDQE